jgi:hypothetical protein
LSRSGWSPPCWTISAHRQPGSRRPTTSGGQNGFAELKTRLRGAAFILRSRSPELVRQELFAFLTVYQSLCSLRAEAAQASGIDPDRISLTVTVRIVRDHAASQTAVTMHSVAQARRRAIRDVLGDLLPARRSWTRPTATSRSSRSQISRRGHWDIGWVASRRNAFRSTDHDAESGASVLDC